MEGLFSQQVYEIAGFLGVAFYLGSYAALQLGYIQGAGYTYACLNLMAAALVLLSLVMNFNLWSAIIQISWITISIFGITRFFILSRRVRFSPEERALVELGLSEFPVLEARQLLNAGIWFDKPAGEAITTQGQEIGFLYYLADGKVQVSAGGSQIREMAAPNFIGELTCFSGGPASATLQAISPIRLFAIETGTLKELCRRNPDIRTNLEASLARDTHKKLIEVTKQLSAG
ncbi:cyclic nucleotide-binding domain-containing protein [Aliiroseovarius sp. KMU-50]|uniref:Cyclic nucleotide-binding domain-containing protein n=1 Tax=Aliiroseovarius salicola TaxID=3009082 RepID=A0ABT4W2T8_9RHOB|nr:cyclic nucleotide-binding domain-containing protein [Aliiroseovarius sp. KMU-50]MDA5094823.1 cyclic nucleotide-binding domain-containing protein [Aliiroseovarius sp. KMU-50]